MTPTQSSSRPPIKSNTLLSPPHHDTPRSGRLAFQQKNKEQEVLMRYRLEAAKAAREFSKFHKEVEERNKATCCTEGCVVS